MTSPPDRFADDDDPRILTRDRNLPEGAIVLVQEMGQRPTQLELNYKMLVYEDGRIFVARHSGKDRSKIVDTDFPDKPEKKMGKAFADSIKQALLDERFFDLEDVQRSRAKDGWIRLMLARVDGRTNEIMYVMAKSKVFELLGLK